MYPSGREDEPHIEEIRVLVIGEYNGDMALQVLIDP